jgi:hypothetical protein
VTCSGEPGHPRYQAGDAEDPVFDGDELLYRRYIKAHFPYGRLLPAAFSFPRPSFNRGKYSVPQDVLHSDCCEGRALDGWGVLQCAVTELPTPVDGADGRRFFFSPMHQPRECCYAHSEVWCTEEGNITDTPSKKVREEFRVRLAQKMIVRIVASA